MVVVGGGHFVSMLTGGDGSLVYQSGLCRPECFEGVKSFDDSWTDGFAYNPHLLLLGIDTAPLDNAEANVNNVLVSHHEVGAT